MITPLKFTAIIPTFQKTVSSEILMFRYNYKYFHNDKYLDFLRKGVILHVLWINLSSGEG